jgi:hypothetical protein
MGVPLLGQKNKDRLGLLHDEFLRGEISSYIIVRLQADGTVNVDFDFDDQVDLRLVIPKLGSGLGAANQHCMAIMRELDAGRSVSRR